MRVAIATRIFAPEPSAASFRLSALAEALAEHASVEVLTVRAPRGLKTAVEHRWRISRFPVLRDRIGYVRGYVQYLSFDVPLFFRILFGPKRDLIVVEPPPTTGFAVRIAAWLRRTPYAYYAADVWSDASESTGAPGLVVRFVRAIEAAAMNGALRVLSVNQGVTERIEVIAPHADVATVGNGVDTAIFTVDGVAREGGQYFIYSGTASEWQGAAVFIRAFAQIAAEFPAARLVFLGQGSDWPVLQETAQELVPERVEFVPTVPPEEAATWIRGAQASLASIKPESGYDFAFPTKVFASWACGTPVIYAGLGPVRAYMEQYASEARLGEAASFDDTVIAEAMRTRLINGITASQRHELGEWAATHVSLRAVAERATDALAL